MKLIKGLLLGLVLVSTFAQAKESVRKVSFYECKANLKQHFSFNKMAALAEAKNNQQCQLVTDLNVEEVALQLNQSLSYFNLKSSDSFYIKKESDMTWTYCDGEDEVCLSLVQDVGSDWFETSVMALNEAQKKSILNKITKDDDAISVYFFSQDIKKERSEGNTYYDLLNESVLID